MSQASDTHWPPRSPHEALLSTPGGRDRIRRLAERASPSPSPIKRSISAASARKRTGSLPQEAPSEEDEEDEETLQLQLQEIQARLRLKKLQKKTRQGSDGVEGSEAGLMSKENLAASSRAQSRASVLGAAPQSRVQTQASIHVPVSPIKRARTEVEQRSPGRVLLGIDKGLRGCDVSLKRAPNLRRPTEGGPQDSLRLGGFLQRASSQVGNRSAASESSQSTNRPLSFSEKLASLRSQDVGREERETRRRNNRSLAFDIDQQQMEGYKQNATEIAAKPVQASQFSRDEVLSSFNKPAIGLSRSKTLPTVRSNLRGSSDTSDKTAISSTTSRPQSFSGEQEQLDNSATKTKVQPGEVTESEASEFEPYSSIHLSKRIIPHKVLTRTFTGKKTFLVPDLLRIVKGPDFSGPDIEEDMVVLAVIASKSEPKTHQNNGNNDQRGKYIVMSLTDLKWELDLFMFGTAFDKFYKLTPGTIIALLNPTIMPPPRGREATGKFSLTLNSSEDTVLEIGTARDLGYCKSIKKDGKACNSWIDKRHTEFCDYHVSETIKKTQSKRMEINTMNFGRSGNNGGRKFNSQDMTGYFERKRESEQGKKTRYDRESHSQIFIGGRTTAKLLDDNDFLPDAFHRGSTKDERLTRTLMAREKERDLAEKLGRIGGGLGADYLRKKSTSSRHDQSSSQETVAEPVRDAASLGLLKGKEADLHLSPVKRKRATTASSASAVGWGSNLTKELGRMKNGESLRPVKKKTRFVTEKGIREAGRESFGGEIVQAASNDLDDDDDDDLDIVR
ncbi:hypothetical protein BP6252_00938 [Coleophoma cylindrospora]|uniref:Uncharacterized protein n=1 Tax=Coleophoma cylindrospora TaxID=1849047 RepID=A0A3D8SRG9_9HELO|nr:hypothetical protein BP6252_00938 [Coleophoma cylindrospora]